MKLLGNMNIRDNMLYIGDKSCESLAKEFGTPLFIVDQKNFVNTCREYRENFKGTSISTRVLYASKAMLNIQTAKVIKDEGLFIDVVSGGELYTVIKADFPAERIYFHGNNKLDKELELAIDYNVGTIVVDNRDEINNIVRILKDKNKVQKVLLRVNPGIEAHTHEYIKTSKNDSKFGESIFDDEIFNIIEEMSRYKEIDFKGFHCHIGSQIFQEDSFFKEAQEMMDFCRKVKDKLNIGIEDLNLGGGFGVYYTQEDKPFNTGNFLKNLIKKIEDYNDSIGLGLKTVEIEPGRSLICNSGSTLYTVGGTKDTFGGKNYIFVDGGMTDNPRPALYQAKYEAIIANKVKDKEEKLYTIAGKCCESGDILIKDIMLPVAQRGDLILISSTGAYTYSMSSNYNRVEKPAMVFVEDDRARLVVRRQSYEDIISNDVI